MSSPSFEFNVLTTTGNTPNFTVVSFEGSEGLSQLYEYVIELKTPTSSTASATFLDDLLDGDPEFKIIYGSDEYPVYGMLADFTEKYSAANYTYYTATLVPRLWQLTLSRDSKVYNDPAEDTVLEILTSMLGKYNLDYIVGDVTGDLLIRDYRCQFNETDFSFISRLLENEGIFYYFDHSDGTDKIVFSNGVANTDGFSSSSELPFDASPPASTLYDSINSWSCRKKRLPANLSMESYYPETPSTNPSGDYDISASLVGEQYIFGENIHDDIEGAYLAQIRAEEFSINTTKYYGESGVCGLRSGYSFSLTNHPNTTYNKATDYVVSEVNHRGTFLDNSVSVANTGGIQSAISGSGNSASDSSPLYVNSFVAIDSDEQYRPARITPKPSFHGTLTAVVYSETKGDYAELDTEGRYRVLLPFRSNSAIDDAERVSHRIRMSQPYAGGVTRNGNWEAEGVYYPLMDNTEVLLAFVNGDPDRPIITGAVPNALVPALLDSTNSNQVVLSTHGMYKKDIRGGATTITKVNDSAERGDTVGDDNDMVFELLNTNDATTTGQLLDEESGDYIVTRRYGHEYIFVNGNTYKWDNEKAFSFGNDYEEIHERTDCAAGEAFDMQAPMQSIGSHPTGGDYSDWEDGGDGLIEKSWGDKCEFHFGRGFNWSGGSGPGGSLETYNYGNGYTENLLACSGGTAASNNLSASFDSYAAYGIDPSSSTIEKTFGDTYSYQNGFSAEVKVGNAKSATHGDSEATVYGNSKETIHGNADNMVMGATSDMFLGAKNEMEVSAANSMKLSVFTDITLGAALEIFVGGKIVIEAAGELELGTAKAEVDVTKLQARVSEIEAKTNKLGAVASDIKTCATKINSIISEIDSSTISIQTGGLTVIS